MNVPAISVIIPMYNAEKFIDDCLNSLLIQTFQDFEVIVVDDCSTDSSCAIVEGYAEKFNGRLTLTRTKTNSGGGGYVPRNIGLGLSRGEYIFFLDADDFIVETALEILYGAAQNFDADVVYTSAYYLYVDTDNFAWTPDYEGLRRKKNGEEDVPTLTRDNPNENLRRLLLTDGLLHMPWAKFVERRLLVENEIYFPKIISGGDFIWTIHLLSCAKKFLRLPIALYFYRNNATESVTRKKRNPQEQISTCVKAFCLGEKALRELAGKVDLLAQDPEYFLAVLSPFFLNCLQRTAKARAQLSSQDIYKILSRDFPESSLVPFLFTLYDEKLRS